MGFGARVVRTAIAQITAHGLVLRYQVEEHNEESTGLARSIGPDVDTAGMCQKWKFD
jgi:hypothetical protein